MNASRRSTRGSQSRFGTPPESTGRSAGRVGAVLLMLLCLGMPGIADAGVEHERVCNVGLNLGGAYGRLQVFGTPGFAVTPPDQIAAITTNLGNASAEIAAFEPLVNTLHISPGRSESVRMIRTDLERMAREAADLATRDAQRVESIKDRYRQTLRYVNRDGHLYFSSTCDSCLLDACFHFAAAHIASVIEQDGPRRTLLNRHLGMMRNAIRSGIDLSWDNITGTYDPATGRDRSAQGGVRTLRRMCCPFGREPGWLPLLSLGPNTTWAEFSEFERYLRGFVREIKAVDCDSSDAHKGHHGYAGCYKDNNQAEPRGLGGRQLGAAMIADDPEMTILKCISHCRQGGHSFAGLQYSRWCFCGSNPGERFADDGPCNMKCSGDTEETCGGSWANSVYETASRGNNQHGSESENCPPGYYLGIDGTCAKIGGDPFGQ